MALFSIRRAIGGTQIARYADSTYVVAFADIIIGVIYAIEFIVQIKGFLPSFIYYSRAI